MFSVAGVLLISCDSEFAGNLLGILLVVFSALTAALYKVTFNYRRHKYSDNRVVIYIPGVLVGYPHTSSRSISPTNFIPNLNGLH